MTHEYDDPISEEAMIEVCSLVMRLGLAEGRPITDIAREAVMERFCSCVASPDRDDNSSILEALIGNVADRVQGMLDARQMLNRVDRASLDSFPASDPPGWINSEPTRK